MMESEFIDKTAVLRENISRFLFVHHKSYFISTRNEHLSPWWYRYTRPDLWTSQKKSMSRNKRPLVVAVL
jgi:hypothetical protein